MAAIPKRTREPKHAPGGFSIIAEWVQPFLATPGSMSGLRHENFTSPAMARHRARTLQKRPEGNIGRGRVLIPVSHVLSKAASGTPVSGQLKTKRAVKYGRPKREFPGLPLPI